ncbi:hypothetical protein SKAU_G00272990 [Synaphobranchus kaupii]|uniref:Uncharacterized protein n=1 Tax=Synaphobranchus kaupii TaxID=118154 RepID=A0A9Q1F0V5_SYNKA|nr:hypothetical protein SKAU_G00272990 [Synaphobranchus kaupii]
MCRGRLSKVSAEGFAGPNALLSADTRTARQVRHNVSKAGDGHTAGGFYDNALDGRVRGHHNGANHNGASHNGANNCAQQHRHVRGAPRHPLGPGSPNAGPLLHGAPTRGTPVTSASPPACFQTPRRSRPATRSLSFISISISMVWATAFPQP